MDEHFDIQLGSKRNINSVNTDIFTCIDLKISVKEVLQYNTSNTLSSNDVFDAEREINENYRIYGKIEYISLLNNLLANTPILDDFFIPKMSGNTKTLLNSFNFYLVKPATTGYTQTTIDGDNTYYVRKFDVITTINNIDIFPAGFSNNVYNEQTYGFTVNVDIDITGILDQLGFPLTELYLYADFKTDTNISKQRTNWDSNGVSTIIPYNYEEKVYGDIIQFDRENFAQYAYSAQTHYINVKYLTGVGTLFEVLSWKFNPLIPIRLRYFDDSVNKVNINDVSYDETSKIPYYALSYPDDSGAYRIWREIQLQGYIDPTTGLGVDYPFVNNRRYCFNTIIIDIIPNLDHENTNKQFKDLMFGLPTTLNIIPTTPLNDIGKQC